MTDTAFDEIARMVRVQTGIVLNAGKRDLVYGRLGRRLRELGCGCFEAYLDLLNGPDNEAERSVMINALTTNLTGFFRENHHFDMLEKEILPELVAGKASSRGLRIWSAGCSSGEEPYSIAMSVSANLPASAARDALILATDIDTNMVATAAAGRYEESKAAPIPAAYRQRFIEDAGDGTIKMQPAIKSMIRFKPLNLLEAWPMRGTFDVIFCRNVVIYFDKDLQKRLFDRYADILAPNGFLFIGHSESLFRVSDRFRHLGRTCYRKIR
jgi:chemotaxis protein methyltransferase CheR